MLTHKKTALDLSKAATHKGAKRRANGVGLVV